jgi:hypothetical protein
MSTPATQNNHSENNNRGVSKLRLSNNILPSISSALYLVSFVGPYVLIGFFLLLSIFNQNLKGVAYLVGICVLFAISGGVSRMLEASAFSNNRKCGDHGVFHQSNGLPPGTLVYVFSFFYLITPMVTTGIVNMPLLVSLALMTIVDAAVNLREKCTDMSFIMIAIVFASIIGTLWSVLIYSVKRELAYHTDYISSNKLACSLPSKQKFKCVVKKNGEIIG